MDNQLYPIDILTFIDKNKELPQHLNKSLQHTTSLGFYNLQITPDDYTIKPYHCGFKHLKEITIPKIENIKNNIKGFFIAEGDLWINSNFYFNDFIEMNIKHPTWLGYKKKLKDYIVGNFLVYIPITYLLEFKMKLDKQKRLVYSDRFFTKLVEEGWLKITNKTYAGEIVHYSNVLGAIRK